MSLGKRLAAAIAKKQQTENALAPAIDKVREICRVELGLKTDDEIVAANLDALTLQELRQRAGWNEALAAERTEANAAAQEIEAEAFVVASDAKGRLLQHGDLLGALPETRRELIVDGIAADAALSGHDEIGALAAMTATSLNPKSPLWEKAFEHSLSVEPEPDPRADWSGEKADSWLRHNFKEPEPARDVIVGADGKLTSDLPPIAEMLKDIEADDAWRAKQAKPADDYERFFPQGS